MNSEQTKQLDEAYDAVIEALVSVPGMKTVQAHIKDLRSERDAAIAERDERKRRQQDTTAAMSCERQMREAAEAELAALKVRLTLDPNPAHWPNGIPPATCYGPGASSDAVLTKAAMKTYTDDTPSEPTPTGEPVTPTGEAFNAWLTTRLWPELSAVTTIRNQMNWLRSQIAERDDAITVLQALVGDVRNLVAERDARIGELMTVAGQTASRLRATTKMLEEATDETS